MEFSESTGHIRVYWVRTGEEHNQTLGNGKVEFLRTALCWQLKSAGLKKEEVMKTEVNLKCHTFVSCPSLAFPCHTNPCTGAL